MDRRTKRARPSISCSIASRSCGRAKVARGGASGPRAGRGDERLSRGVRTSWTTGCRAPTPRTHASTTPCRHPPARSHRIVEGSCARALGLCGFLGACLRALTRRTNASGFDDGVAAVIGGGADGPVARGCSTAMPLCSRAATHHVDRMACGRASQGAGQGARRSHRSGSKPRHRRTATPGGDSMATLAV